MKKKRLDKAPKFIVLNNQQCPVKEIQQREEPRGIGIEVNR